MLKFTSDQIEAIRPSVLSRFESGLLQHTERYFRNHWRALGAEPLRETIRLGIARAKIHRLVSQRDVYLYVGVMLYLGSGFDTDLQLPWARRLLEGEDIAFGPSRAESVYDEAREHMRRVYGLANEHLDAALQRGRNVFGSPLTIAPIRSEADLLAGLAWLFPKKFDAAGPGAMHALAVHGAEAIRQRNIATTRGAVLYMGLMFMLGQGFDSDPQFPWAAAALADDVVRDPAQRVERLANQSRAQLALWTG